MEVKSTPPTADVGAATPATPPAGAPATPATPAPEKAASYGSNGTVEVKATGKSLSEEEQIKMSYKGFQAKVSMLESSGKITPAEADRLRKEGADKLVNDPDFRQLLLDNPTPDQIEKIINDKIDFYRGKTSSDPWG